MSDILASSITLEDILNVAQSKRVPIAPELAGYLTLELADAANAHGATSIDTKTVYVSEEGSVAIVKPKTPGASDDVEAQLREVLTDLLAVTGSQTTALSQVAKRKSGAGVRALATELEAALIPVNRAAGRRALARMAREARRISLGLGRAGALPPPESRRSPERDARSEREEKFHEAPTAQRPRTPFPSDEASTRRADAPPATRLPAQPINRGPAPPPPPLRAPARKGVGLPAVPELGKPGPLGLPEKLFGGDEVDSLLSTFGVTGDASDDDRAMSHELKSLVGLGPTPPPPGTEANFDDRSDQIATHRLAVGKEDVTADPPSAGARGKRAPSSSPPLPIVPVPGGDGDGIEDLLAMSDESMPVVASGQARPPADSLDSEGALGSDDDLKPIAVANVTKAGLGSSSRMRAARDAAPPIPNDIESGPASAPPRPVVAPPKPVPLTGSVAVRAGKASCKSTGHDAHSVGS